MRPGRSRADSSNVLARRALPLEVTKVPIWCSVVPGILPKHQLDVVTGCVSDHAWATKNSVELSGQRCGHAGHVLRCSAFALECTEVPVPVDRRSTIVARVEWQAIAPAIGEVE